jgi:hypothetical protein
MPGEDLHLPDCGRSRARLARAERGQKILLPSEAEPQPASTCSPV